MDLHLLAAAYDRSAAGYDERFRPLQRTKFRVAAPLLRPLPAGARCLDAGGGTGLFSEWLAAGPDEEPSALLRASLAQARWLVLDASLGMLQVARGRGAVCVAADLALPPSRPRSFELVIAFTSVLERVSASLASLSTLVAAQGTLCLSFLAEEALSAAKLEGATGLRMRAQADAGQDRIFVLER